MFGKHLPNKVKLKGNLPKEKTGFNDPVFSVYLSNKTMGNHSKLKLARLIMLLAAIYNAIWGIVISVYPQIILFGNPPANFTLILLRCIGMLVGTYALAYYFSYRDPARYWPLIFVGFVGKILGPVGSAYYISIGKLTPQFLYVNLLNDLIWLIPFGWLLYMVWKGKLATRP